MGNPVIKSVEETLEKVLEAMPSESVTNSDLLTVLNIRATIALAGMIDRNAVLIIDGHTISTVGAGVDGKKAMQQRDSRLKEAGLL